MGKSLRYRFFNHTADVEFLAFGNTLEELSANALEAMFSTIADISILEKSPEKPKTVKMAASSDNETDMIWHLIQNTLSKAEAMNLFCYKVKSINIARKPNLIKISVIVICKKKSSLAANVEVKAVSRYQIRVDMKNRRWRARVVLDV